MSDAGGSHASVENPEEKFLLAEYQALIDLDKSRNDRLDRFLTMFVSLAAAPWALYALIVKDNPGATSLAAVPAVVAVGFVLIGVFDALVTMMFIQMRFTIILYSRALNSIRGYFLAEDTRLSFRLPTTPQRPRYYESGSYIQIAIAGMSLVNAGYVGFGLYQLVGGTACFSNATLWFGLLTAAIWIAHLIYYYMQADRREPKGEKTRELHWDKN